MQGQTAGVREPGAELSVREGLRIGYVYLAEEELVGIGRVP